MQPSRQTHAVWGFMAHELDAIAQSVIALIDDMQIEPTPGTYAKDRQRVLVEMMSKASTHDEACMLFELVQALRVVDHMTQSKNH